MTEKEFWMVWRLHGNAPTFRHQICIAVDRPISEFVSTENAGG